ncbi:hypothetical protein D3C78_1425900 [compost metagenome]
MHTVIVTRCQVSGGEQAVAERLSQYVVAGQQRLKAVVMTFSLENLVVVDWAELAYRAICRQRQPVGAIDDRTCAVTQGANKEVVEGRIRGQVRILCFLHIHAVIAGEALHH